MTAQILIFDMASSMPPERPMRTAQSEIVNLRKTLKFLRRRYRTRFRASALHNHGQVVVICSGSSMIARHVAF
jgi:hypothetical protein